ncbi:MAG: LemA family protein [Bacilli bacterium]|nr:LemA family protein [Bacilli bacterium]
MSGIQVLLLIIIAVTILLLIYAGIYNVFQNYLIRIHEVESNIDNNLRNKFDILNKASKTFKNNDKNDQIISNRLNELQDSALTSFDFDRNLIELADEFCQLNERKKTNQTYIKICLELDEVNEKLSAYKHYYNDNILILNKLIKKFPTNIVAKISHFREMPFYDGKNLNDEITNDFKI